MIGVECRKVLIQKSKNVMIRDDIVSVVLVKVSSDVYIFYCFNAPIVILVQASDDRLEISALIYLYLVLVNKNTIFADFSASHELTST